MFDLTLREVNDIADKADFNRNMTEKVLRLYSVLRFIDESFLGDWLVLKGGTAINLFLLNLPRLSVDIDMDFNLPVGREEMLSKRVIIDRKIRDFMADEGYYLSDRSKFFHSLDSYVYSYQTASGSYDILKIEINYSDRVHVLKTKRTESSAKLESIVTVRRLADEELIGSKINALLVRTTPRDIYDVYNLFKSGLTKNEKIIRKIAIFYVCLGYELPLDFSAMVLNACKNIENLSYSRVRNSLIPVLQKGNDFDLLYMKEYVSEKIKSFFVLDENDYRFISEMNKKHFQPSILFEGIQTEDLSNHPMGLWKTK